MLRDIPTNVYQFKVNNRNRKRCEICSKLTIKTPERRHWRRPDFFIANFEHILRVFLMFAGGGECWVQTSFEYPCKDPQIPYT